MRSACCGRVVWRRSGREGLKGRTSGTGFALDSALPSSFVNSTQTELPAVCAVLALAAVLRRASPTKTDPATDWAARARLRMATVTITTLDGDVGVLTYAPLDPAAIEASVRSSKAGAVVSFVRSSFALSQRPAELIT